MAYVRTPGGTSGSTSTGALGAFTLNELARMQAVNWYGLDEQPGSSQHVPPTFAQLLRIKREGVGGVRLPVCWTIEDSVLDQVLTDADAVGLRVFIEAHTYGHTGGTNKTQANGGGGTLIDPNVQSTVDTWTAWCVGQMTKFGRHPSYVPLDMNEPSQTGVVWENISRQRVAALRAAGWTGLIGVSAGGGGSSAAGLNNATLGHPNGWWLADDPGCFLEVHLYFSSSVIPQTNWVGLNDQVVGGTTYQGLNSRAAAAGVSGATDISTYVSKKIIEGMFGTSKWDDVPKFVGEWAFPPPYDVADVSPVDGSVLFPTTPFNESAADKTGKLAVHQQILTYFRSRDTGSAQWAYPANWTSGYRWKVNAAQLTSIGKANRASSTSSSSSGSGFNYRGAWTATTAYAVNDVISNAGSTYLVTTAFTSGSTFSTTNLSVWAAKGDSTVGAPGPALSVSNKPLTTGIYQRSALMTAGAGGALVSGTVMLHPFFVARGGTSYDAFGFTATTAQVAGSGSGTLLLGLYANQDEFLWPNTTALLASGSISSQTAANTNVAVPFASALSPAQDTIYWVASLYVAGATAPTSAAILASVTGASYELSAPSSSAAYNNFRGITITGQTDLPTTALTYTTTGLTVSSGNNVACVYLRRSA